MANQNTYFNKHFRPKKIINNQSPKKLFPITAIMSSPHVLFLTCPILPSKANQCSLTFPNHWMISGAKGEPR